MEGGSANDYDYAGGDPIDEFDLVGLCWTGWKCFEDEGAEWESSSGGTVITTESSSNS